MILKSNYFAWLKETVCEDELSNDKYRVNHLSVLPEIIFFSYDTIT